MSYSHVSRSLANQETLFPMYLCFSKVGKPWFSGLYMNILNYFSLDACRLIKNVFSEVSVDLADECAHQCLQDIFCVGYNFKEKQMKKPNCQLTHKPEHKFHSCNKDDKGWSFFHAVGPRKVGIVLP